jgi:hypothetical protein
MGTCGGERRTLVSEETEEVNGNSDIVGDYRIKSDQKKVRRYARLGRRLTERLVLETSDEGIESLEDADQDDEDQSEDGQVGLEG